MNNQNEIPVFFASDDNYIPCLAVAIHSLEKNASKKNNYRLIILHSGMSEKGQQEIKEFEQENIKIEFKDISNIENDLKDDLALRLRDYYSSTIYYRIFIGTLFPEYHKAVYIDSDVILLDDIANLYNTDLEGNIIGAIPDGVVHDSKKLQDYVEVNDGVENKKYFNSGVLVIDLDKFRETRVDERFVRILTKYNCDTIAPDQDYLNILCKDKVKYLPLSWDKMPDYCEHLDEKDIHLIHYNMFRKPWHYRDVEYSDIFWKYAKETKYYDELKKELEAYTDEQRQKDAKGGENMVVMAENIMKSNQKFTDIKENI